jgi:hypothetical protein
MVETEYVESPCQGQELSGSWPRRIMNPSPSLLGAGLEMLMAMVFLLGACDPGGNTAPSPPPGVLEFLGAEQVRAQSPVQGLAYYQLDNRDEPWAVHLLRMEMDRCELGLKVLEAPAGNGVADGRATVSELALQAGSSVLAAVNGDFFTPEGRPLGTEVVGGVPRRILARPVLAWRPGGRAWMGYPEVRDDSLLALGWLLPREKGDSVTQAVGGFPLLLLQGSRVGDLEVEDRPSFASERHPRTAAGFDEDDDLLWIVVVDGRQPEHSVGMSLPELADLMAALEVEDAINLDGGGSSVMVVEGEVMSSPSDSEGQRPVGNALGILLDPSFCQIRGEI